MNDDQAARYVAPSDLRGWEEHPNPRENADAVAAVVASIRRFGFGAPIVALEDGRIIAGETRWKAARELVELGELERVPVRFVELEEAEARAYRLADNRLGELSSWHPGLLADELRELTEEGLDLDGLGWDPRELEALTWGEGAGPGDGSAGDPGATEPAGIVDSKNGEAYLLGPHRLMCGDCRDPVVVAQLLDGAQINVAFTSPPYASQRKYDESSGFKPIKPDAYVEWFEAVQANVREHLAVDGSWFVNITEAASGGWKLQYVKRLLLAHVDSWEWGWVEEYCWPRPALPLNPDTSRRFKNGWESVHHFALVKEYKFRPDDVRHETGRAFVYADQKAAGKMIVGTAQGVGGNIMDPVGKRRGLAYPSNVLSNMGGARVVGHSAAFPVALPSFFVRAFSDPGDVIFDPFLGSGTTLIAAAQHDRIAYGCEISAGYCDVIRRRWTGYAQANGIDPGSGALEPLEAEE